MHILSSRFVPRAAWWSFASGGVHLSLRRSALRRGDSRAFSSLSSSVSRRKCEISVPGSFEFQHEESWKLCAVRGSIPVLPHELAAYTQRCPYESNRVVKTNGLVEPDFEVLKALEQMVVDNPFLTIRVLDALVRS